MKTFLTLFLTKSFNPKLVAFGDTEERKAEPNIRPFLVKGPGLPINHAFVGDFQAAGEGGEIYRVV